jgi:hypothetical protein
MSGSGFSDTPAPYAGPNRIRFNGFAGGPHGQPASQVFSDHPKAARIVAAVAARGKLSD